VQNLCSAVSDLFTQPGFTGGELRSPSPSNQFGRVEMSNGSEKIETARSPQTPTSVDLHIDPRL
jgi:hypothetical protein